MPEIKQEDNYVSHDWILQMVLPTTGALDEMLGHMASIVNNYSIKLDIFSKDKAARKWLGFSSIQGLFQSRKAIIGLY